jgi:fatty acid-binding protein DegV
MTYNNQQVAKAAIESRIPDTHIGNVGMALKAAAAKRTTKQ